MGIGRFNNTNLLPLDIIRTVVIIGMHIAYALTAWRDFREYDNLFFVIFGQCLLSIALIMSIMDNFGYAPKLPKKIHNALLRFFDWVQGYNRKK